MIGRRARRSASLGVLVLATALLSWKAVSGVLAKVGHPAAALDDAYIHFQYARAVAEAHPFRYHAGAPISTGATSLLWPTLLAPFFAVGFRGEALMWPAWLFSFVALGALAYEAHRLTEPLAGRTAGAAAAAMVLSFGGLVWCAASGMEAVPFAWSIAAASRRAAEWAEAPQDERTPRRLKILLGLAFVGPLLRPEGSITALALAVVVFAFPPPSAGIRLRGRAWSSVFVVASLGPSLLLLAMTGRFASSTAEVKLLIGNPYHPFLTTFAANVRLLFGTILDGAVWSAEFLPPGGSVVACAGVVAVALRGAISKRYVRSALVLLLAASILIPCAYVTFLWNRLRYLWPFATGWLVGLACLSRVVADAAMAAKLGRSFATTASALLGGAFVGMFAMRLDWVLDDVAQSASGIDRQQATLGRWAAANLPAEARIGVNDTGAIAYFGDRRTFDIVGLTTPSEGRYWVGGSAARFEHYERMPREALPTHFIVYPEWMGCEPLLGRTLYEAVVTDATILGGQVMRVYEARWEGLGTGARPWTPLATVHDELDVADLDSESAHRYELAGAREGEETVEEDSAPAGDSMVDGGRTNRTADRFTVDLPPGAKLVAIARVQLDERGSLRLAIDGEVVSRVAVEPGPWREVTLPIPEGSRGARRSVTVDAGGATFTSFHYWFGAPP